MKYKCEKCNYETVDKSNFNKHTKSKAHAKKTGSLQKIDKKIDKKCQQKKLPSCFQCSNCHKIYSSVSSLSRHKSKFCKVGIIKNQVEQELKQEFDEKLKQKELEIKLEYTEKLLEKTDTENKELKQFIKNTKPSTTNYNISVKKLVQQTFPDAPYLSMLDNYRIIHEDEDIDLTQDLIYYHNKNRLNKYLGDIIIKYYKKEDPKDQSLWSTDPSRLKYIIKELLASKKSSWNEDDKGLKTTKYIVEPLLKYIKDYINEQIDIIGNKLINANKNECIILAQQQLELAYIREKIQNGILKEEIIRYITPSFKFKSDNLITI